MVDKKLSEFGSIQPSDVSDFVVLYLDDNLSQKNGRLPFNSFVSMLALLSKNNTFIGDNTFSGDVVFEKTATFNKGINGTATRATADASGNNIENTYATKTELDQKSSFKLFHHDWFDYQLNDMSWLRADTFSWQDGTVYSDAYQHLVEDFNNNIPTGTETIGSHTITYYLAEDGHKIVLPDQESVVHNIYEETGVAWYYILDTANQRFKLPRTKYGFTGLRDTVGNYVPESLPDHNHTLDIANRQVYGDGGKNALYGTEAAFQTSPASESNSVYQDGAPVQQRATQMYLYFYVGQFSQSAIEQTAGLNSELLNGKVDLDGHNATFAHIVETYQNGLSWYRVYSDGWCEQGGVYTSSETGVRTINLLKEMANVDYNIQVSIYCDTNDRTLRAKPANTEAFYCQVHSSGSQANATGNICWEVKGYKA